MKRKFSIIRSNYQFFRNIVHRSIVLGISTWNQSFGEEKNSEITINERPIFKKTFLLLCTPMASSMKSSNKIEGASNFRVWKIRIDLILAKNKVLDMVKGKITEPKDDAEKEKFKDNDITTMSLIVDSIRDHLIPYISNLDTSKKMYDAITNLFTVKNVGQVMILKNELCDVKMKKYDTLKSYFVRISQLRNQLQAISETISEKESMTIAHNGLPKSWDAFE